ncbi:MAG: hypothetical protein V4462_16070 [Pseudomonadota bacterium]
MTKKPNPTGARRRENPNPQTIFINPAPESRVRPWPPRRGNKSNVVFLHHISGDIQIHHHIVLNIWTGVLGSPPGRPAGHCFRRFHTVSGVRRQVAGAPVWRRQKPGKLLHPCFKCHAGNINDIDSKYWEMV